MNKVISGLGLMVFLYAISLFSYFGAELLLADKKHPVIRNILFVVYYTFAVFSAPIGILGLFYSKIEEKQYKEETNKKHLSLVNHLEGQISSLEAEISSLKEQVWDERFNRNEEVEHNGWRSGYRSGFLSCLDYCIDTIELPDDQRQSLRLDARSQIEFNIKMKEYSDKLRENNSL